MAFEQMTIAEMRRELQAGRVTAVELTRACLERVEATDEQLNAFITVCAEEALAAAAEADRRIAGGEDAHHTAAAAAGGLF